jgi:Tol biopolymer transport system component
MRTSALAFLLSCGLVACSIRDLSHPLTVNVTGTGTGTVSSIPAGINNCTKGAGACTAEFDEGTSITLEATPEPGFFFSSWSVEGCAGMSTCTISLADAATVRATFVPIVFYSTQQLNSSTSNPNSYVNVWRVRSDGTGAAPVTQLQAAGSYFGFWSPDGEKLVYQSSRSLALPLADALGLRVNTWISNADGSNPVALTQFQAARTNFARWTRDGRIAYSTDAAPSGADVVGTTNLWIVNPDGSGRLNLTNLSGIYSESYMFSLGPDHAYLGSQRGLSEPAKNTPVPVMNVWKVKLDGTEALPLTQSTVANSAFPSLSPDGQKVAYVSNHGLNPSIDSTMVGYNIWVMNADGTNKVPVTQSTGIGTYAPLSWSSDGSRIVYLSNRHPNNTEATIGTTNVWSVHVPTGARTPVTAMMNTNNKYPLVYPDGRVVFDSFRDTNGTDASGATSNLWIVYPDGSYPAPLTTDSIANSYNTHNDG